MPCNQPNDKGVGEGSELSTIFAPPTPLPFPSVIIEFCDRVSLSLRRTSVYLISQLRCPTHNIGRLNTVNSAAGKFTPSLTFRSCSVSHTFDCIIFGSPGVPSYDVQLYACRLHRATWLSTELFLTFPPPVLHTITLVPLNSEDTAGRFRVWLSLGPGGDEGEAQGIPTPVVVWDRKKEGGFPELKVLVGVLDSLHLLNIQLCGLSFTYRNSGFGITSNRAKCWDILTGNEYSSDTRVCSERILSMYTFSSGCCLIR
jgi:predicted Rdx family selenoprotein